MWKHVHERFNVLNIDHFHVPFIYDSLQLYFDICMCFFVVIGRLFLHWCWFFSVKHRSVSLSDNVLILIQSSPEKDAQSLVQNPPWAQICFPHCLHAFNIASFLFSCKPSLFTLTHLLKSDCTFHFQNFSVAQVNLFYSSLNLNLNTRSWRLTPSSSLPLLFQCSINLVMIRLSHRRSWMA